MVLTSGIITVLCNVRMKISVLHLLILLVAALESVRGNSEVKERSSPYSCCGEPTIRFNEQCVNTFNINTKPIAYFKGSSPACIKPCKTIEAGLMTLEECTDVHHTMVCTNERGVTEEERIYYLNQPCSGSLLTPGNQGSVGLLLLAVVIGGLIVENMIS